MQTAAATEPASGEQPGAALGPPAFDALYDTYFDFVWRSVQRLGVAPANCDDAVQDVFIVVHRRLAEFEGRSSVKTWLFGIAIRVASDHRRLLRRKGGHELLEDNIADRAASPMETAANVEAMRTLQQLLEQLDDDRRAVFVLAELEQMTAPEMSEALGVNLNTVYSRLRAARQDFEKAVARFRAKGQQ